MSIDPSVKNVNQLLENYVAGALPLPLVVMAQSYLEISQKPRSYVRSLEAAAGLELEQTEPKSLENSQSMLADILSRDDASKLNSDEQIEIDPIEANLSSLEKNAGHPDWMPQALHNFAKCDDVPWRTKLPGFKVHKLPDIDGCEAELLWIAQGRAMPSHTHEGSEFTLVLQGSFEDETGEYHRGDIGIADHTATHRPVAGDNEPCICLAISSGPVKLKGPIGQRMRDVFGL